MKDDTKPIARRWMTMHEALELGFTYRDLEARVADGEILTRRSGATVLYDQGSLERSLAASDIGRRSA